MCPLHLPFTDGPGFDQKGWAHLITEESRVAPGDLVAFFDDLANEGNDHHFLHNACCVLDGEAEEFGPFPRLSEIELAKRSYAHCESMLRAMRAAVSGKKETKKGRKHEVEHLSRSTKRRIARAQAKAKAKACAAAAPVQTDAALSSLKEKLHAMVTSEESIRILEDKLSQIEAEAKELDDEHRDFYLEGTFAARPTAENWARLLLRCMLIADPTEFDASFDSVNRDIFDGLNFSSVGDGNRVIINMPWFVFRALGAALGVDWNYQGRHMKIACQALRGMLHAGIVFSDRDKPKNAPWTASLLIGEAADPGEENTFEVNVETDGVVEIVPARESAIARFNNIIKRSRE